LGKIMEFGCLLLEALLNFNEIFAALDSKTFYCTVAITNLATPPLEMTARDVSHSVLSDVEKFISGSRFLLLIIKDLDYCNRDCAVSVHQCLEVNDFSRRNDIYARECDISGSSPDLSLSLE
jgi:hypothetical protein